MSITLLLSFISLTNTWPQGYNTFFMLNSAEHEILDALKFKKKFQEIQLFSGSDKLRMLFFLRINVKMPTTVGILTFMSKTKIHAHLS